MCVSVSKICLLGPITSVCFCVQGLPARTSHKCVFLCSGSGEGRASPGEGGTAEETEGEDVTEPLEEDEENRHVHQDHQLEGCTRGELQCLVMFLNWWKLVGS